MGFWGKNIGQNYQKAPILLREMVNIEQSKAHAQSTACFDFAAKKIHLESRYNVDFFTWCTWMPLLWDFSKKICNISFGFWLVSFCLQKIGCSAQTRTGIGLLGKPPAVKQFLAVESHLGVCASYATWRNTGMKRTSVVEHNLYFARLAIVG